MRDVAAVLAITALTVGQVSAQSFCLNPRPSCRVSTITEFHVARKVIGQGDARRSGLGGSLGLMRHVGSRHAVGVLGSLVVQEPGGEYFLLNVRLRTWVSPTLVVDLSPGLIVSSVGSARLEDDLSTPGVRRFRTALLRRPAFTIDAAASYRDWLTGFVRVNVSTYGQVHEVVMTETLGSSGVFLEESGATTEVFLGLRTGSYIGLALDAAVPLAVGIFFLVVCKSGGCTS